MSKALGPISLFGQTGVAFTADFAGVYMFSVVEGNLRNAVKLSPTNGPNPSFQPTIDGLNGFLLCYLGAGGQVLYSSPYTSFNLAGCRLGDELTDE
jgi:hypothetical protein